MHRIYLKKNTGIIAFLLLAAAQTALLSCVTMPDSVGSRRESSSAPMYYGSGSGDSSIVAMAAAKKLAVRQAARDLLGGAAVEDEINMLFDSIEDFDPYILKESQQTIESSSGDTFFYHLGIRINLEALAAKLITNDILGGQISGQSDVIYILRDQAAPVLSTGPVGKDGPSSEVSGRNSTNEGEAAESGSYTVASKITAEEFAVIRRYLDGLSYMVYFNDGAAEPFLARSAVISANRFLEQQGYDYVDLARIETIKKEQSVAYKEETGNAVSMIQWIAHKLNADIYIELSLSTSGNSDGGRFYGTADVSLNCYDVSTFESRGSAEARSNPSAFSLVSIDDALSDAVSSAVFESMEEAVVGAEEESAKVASGGFKYNLTMINTNNSEILRDFEEKLKSQVKFIERTSFSAEQSIFEVYLIGDIADLEDIVYDAAESIPGFEELMLVMQWRNSITFDTGM